MTLVRVVLAALLAASAVVFAVGVGVERSQSTHSDEGVPSVSTGATPEAAEGSAAREAAERKPAAQSQAAPPAETGGDTTERVFGINTESVWLVVLVVLASLLLAAMAIAVRSPLVLGVVIVVALAATAFDVREIAHQLDESRNGVATLAALTMTLHILVALVAAGAAVTDRRRSSPSHGV